MEGREYLKKRWECKVETQLRKTALTFPVVSLYLEHVHGVNWGFT